MILLNCAFAVPVLRLVVIGLGESNMTDSYQRRWMQWASSEPGPLGLPALLRTLPCALSWNTKNKHAHITHRKDILSHSIYKAKLN